MSQHHAETQAGEGVGCTPAKMPSVPGTGLDPLTQVKTQRILSRRVREDQYPLFTEGEIEAQKRDVTGTGWLG